MIDLLTIENKTTTYEVSVFELRDPSQVVPKGTNNVEVYCSLETLIVPKSVFGITIKNGASLLIVPGVHRVTIERVATVGCFSDGTVSIEDERSAKIERDAFDGVRTLRRYKGSLSNNETVWLPPSVEDVIVNRFDKDSLAACVSLGRLTLGHFSDHVLPPSLNFLVIDQFHGGFIPGTVRRLSIRHNKSEEPLRGDFSNLGYLWIDASLFRSLKNAPMPQLQGIELNVHSRVMTDVSDFVFPRGITSLKLNNCCGRLRFPRSVIQIEFNDCDFSN